MKKEAYLHTLATELRVLKENGLYKDERVITSPQQAVIRLKDGSEVINLCANNYLGLSDHPALIEAAKASLDQYGYGMSSVRFICGTQSIHKTLEARLSHFLGTEDTILYSSCFDAGGITRRFSLLSTPSVAISFTRQSLASFNFSSRSCISLLL